MKYLQDMSPEEIRAAAADPDEREDLVTAVVELGWHYRILSRELLHVAQREVLRRQGVPVLYG